MSNTRLLLLLGVVAATPSHLKAQSPELARMAGCTLQARTYTCSKADLKRALSLAATVKTVSQPANHASDNALADLVKKLGKSAANGEGPSDLTIILEPLQEAGVSVGPGTQDLARLRVLVTAPDGSPGKLLWVETYNGDASMPWPAVARATTLALSDRLR